MVGRQEDVGTESHSFVTKVARTRFGTQIRCSLFTITPRLLGPYRKLWILFFLSLSLSLNMARALCA